MMLTVDKPTILLMFSGGVDSLGCLYLLLTEDKYKDYEILVYHIHMKNVENRAIAEHVAVTKIIKYLKENNYRDFMFMDSIFESHVINTNFPWDGDLYNFVAGTLCLSAPSIEMFVLGVNSYDFQASVDLEGKQKRGNAIFNAFAHEGQKKIYPVLEFSKQEIWNFLPKELRELSWSCRRPIYEPHQIRKCGNCKSCREMEKIV